MLSYIVFIGVFWLFFIVGILERFNSIFIDFVVFIWRGRVFINIYKKIIYIVYENNYKKMNKIYW